jgi:glutathione synthase/RimK-type ligase-like ATP-grasp enzyme
MANLKWIKFMLLHESQGEVGDVIYIPKQVSAELNGIDCILFGIRQLEITVKPSDLGHNNDGKHFTEPIIILCTQGVLDKLLIKEELTYQLVKEGRTIHVGPVIGLLLGEQQYYYHDKFMGEYRDALCKYSRIGGLIIAFKTCSIDEENECIYGMFFDPQQKKWCYGKLPIPSVVYMRAYNVSSEVVEKLRVLTDGKIFNPRRINKWQMYRKLRSNPYLKNFLPETRRLTNKEIFNAYLDQYERTIIKPVGLSRGRGIYVFRKLSENRWLVLDYNKGGAVIEESEVTRDGLEDLLEENKILEKNYLIQPYLNLAKINGNPWDIRVVMQKDTSMQWRCNGIECRVAGSGDLVTNISRGGRALSISAAVNLSFGPTTVPTKMKNEIIAIAKELCKTLDQENEQFAELGIDIAMDDEQRYWIIEANVRPTYNGFKEHMNYRNYLHLCSAPIFYAATLAGFQKEIKS